MGCPQGKNPFCSPEVVSAWGTFCYEVDLIYQEVDFFLSGSVFFAREMIFCQAGTWFARKWTLAREIDLFQEVDLVCQEVDVLQGNGLCCACKWAHILSGSELWFHLVPFWMQQMTWKQTM